LKGINKGKRAVNIIENEDIRVAGLNIRKENKFLKESEFLDGRAN
jgi:hypothetical protein